MNTQELLDELSGNILRDRSKLISGPSDKRWTDKTLLNYINEAEQRFARRTLCLRDSDANNPTVTQVMLQAGVIEYTLNPLVLAVVSGRYDTDTYDLKRAGHSLATYNITVEEPPYFDSNTINDLKGRPLMFWTDESVVIDAGSAIRLRVDRTPTADEDGKIIQLRVCRLPTAPMTLDLPGGVPDVPSMYHLDMLDWAAYRALMHGDADVEDIARADKRKVSFERATQELKNELMRKLAPALGWGFGRTGFTWVR